MATRRRAIRVTSDAYVRLEREAVRRAVSPDALADELVAAEPAPASSDLESTLVDLTEIRSRVRGPVDAVAAVCESRQARAVR